MKIISWNVNGLKSWLSRGFGSYLLDEDPDIFCMQEIRCASPECYNDQLYLDRYHIYFNPSVKKGYSGVAILTKILPISIASGIGEDKFDQEGRILTAEFDGFYLVNVYSPNAGQGLKRLDFRLEWEDALLQYLDDLKSKKEVILTGDLNVAHTELDIARPKDNENHAGFTAEERMSFSRLLDSGFIDVFRALNPTKREYTYWTYMFAARRHNIGWRLDYFVVSNNLMHQVIDCYIQTTVLGSDHCPVVLTIRVV